ncbi:MAG: PDGLE domain-containing protein [Chloroflexota bacterium]
MKRLDVRLKWWHAGLAIALLVMLSPLASTSPDGLEKVAEDKGFADRAVETPFHVIPEYIMPGVQGTIPGRILAGIVGSGVLLALGWGLARLLRRRNET